MLAGHSRQPEHSPGDMLSGHWTWRPDWTSEQRSVWWYGSFENDATVQEVAAEARRAIKPEAPVDAVPSRWLHLSLVEVGYAAQLTRTLLSECARAARSALAGVPPLDLEVGPVGTLPGAVVLDARAPDLGELYHRLVTALASTRPHPPAQRAFAPHVSVAYLRRDCTRDEIFHASPRQRRETRGRDVGSTRLTEIVLAEVVRDRPYYRWTPRYRLALEPRCVASAGTGNRPSRSQPQRCSPG